MAAVLTCRRYDREWEKKHGLLKNSTALNRREVQQWAVAQKHANGLDVMHEEYKQRLSRWNVTPNMWIFPPKLCLYLSMIAPEKSTFQDAGVKGQSTFAAGPSALTTFRGVNVYETRMFDVYEGDLPIDLLRRNQTIGQYNTMNDPLTGRTVDDYVTFNYTSSMRDTVVYDEDRDQWAKVGFTEALKAVERPDDFENRSAPLSHMHTDVLHYREGNAAQLKRCQVFGQMEKDFLSWQSLLIVAKTMSKSIPTKTNPDGSTEKALEPEAHFANIQSLVHQYSYSGPDSVPMFKLKSRGGGGVSLSDVTSLIRNKGLDPQFIADTAGRLNDAGDQQRFLQGVVDYVASTQPSTLKNFYKALSKKAPRSQVELRSYLADSAFWNDKADVSAAVSQDVWERTSETWDPKYRNDANWMPGDPATGYTTASKVAYAPSHRWEDTPWAVAAQSSAYTPQTRAARTEGFGHDLDDILGPDASHKVARIGANPARYMNEEKTSDELNGVGEDLGKVLATENGAKLWDQVNGNEGRGALTPHEQQCARIFLTAHATMKNIIEFASKDVWVPFEVMLMRSHMEYEMCSAVLMKGGMETGMTAVGHNDFQLGDDVASKMHYGHYTFKSKAFVQQPRNIIIAENIFAQGYVGGNGTVFHTAEEDPKDASMHVWLTGLHKRPPQSPLDMSGYFGGHGAPNTKPHMAGAGYHQINGNWSQMSADNEDDDPMRSILENEHKVNTVCYQGHQFNYSLTTRMYDKVTRNTGHWGPNVYPGCAAVRAGEAHSFRECHYVDTPH